MKLNKTKKSMFHGGNIQQRGNLQNRKNIGQLQN